MASQVIEKIFNRQNKLLVTNGKITKSDLSDLYVVLIIYILPSKFLGFLPGDFFYIRGHFDLEMFVFLLTLPLLITQWKYFRKFLNTKFGKLLLIVVFFIIVRFFYSLIQGIPLKEVITIFRKGFDSPISCLALALYFYPLNADRIFRILRWIFILFSLNVFFYIINTMGVPIFPAGHSTFQTLENISLNRTLVGFPIFYLLFVALILSKFIETGRRKFLILFFIVVSAAILSATRSTIITTFVVSLIIGLGYFIKLRKKQMRRLNKIIILLPVAVFILVISSGNVLKFISKKFEITFSQKLSNHTGTYAFRELLINNAVNDIYKSNKILFGNGYKREALPGEYDFVLGRDTGLAPVIYCEGVVGLIIRWIPIIYFLMISIFPIKRKIPVISFELRLIIFAMIFSSVLAIVQTLIFLNYIDLIFWFYLIELISNKTNKLNYASI